MVKFYDKRPELKTTAKYCGINELHNITTEYITKGVPQQEDDSVDCGVFVATSAELVSNGQDIVNQEVNVDGLRKKFGALLGNMQEGSKIVTFKVKRKDRKI